VIAVHRLLKNGIVAATGIQDYMLVTQPCVDDLGIERIVAGWVEHTETYDYVGELRGYVSSLPDVWEFVRQQNEEKVLQRDAWVTVSAHSTAPMAIVWDHLVDPVKRARWMNATTTMVGEQSGRIVPGTEYHCAHGPDHLTILTVLDRRPVDYITFLSPLGEGVAFRYTDYVIASGTGTRIVSYAAAPFDAATGEPLPQEVLAQMAGMFGGIYKGQLDQLADMATAAAATLSTT
jgi:uncharacterized protein YndB with AHSA1/START domain